jgi:hypothetical protein
MDGPARLSDKPRTVDSRVRWFVDLRGRMGELWKARAAERHESVHGGSVAIAAPDVDGLAAGMAQRSFTAGREQGSTQVQEGLIQ